MFLLASLKGLGHTNSTKKNASKNIAFWLSYERLKLGVFRAFLKRKFRWGGECWPWWRHLGQIFRFWSFSRIKGMIANHFLTFPIILNGYQVDVFLCKNERWVQKSWSQCLKIKSISGMTSSIKNLGKFGELYLIEEIQPGDPTEVCKGMPFYAKWDEESKKTSFETWKVVEKAAMAVFWIFFERLNQPKFENFVKRP